MFTLGKSYKIKYFAAKCNKEKQKQTQKKQCLQSLSVSANTLSPSA